MTVICYACTNPGTSSEHVPPQCLFPEAKDTGGCDLRRQLVTVPACEAHNSAKSRDDEFLLWVLSANVCANATGAQQAVTKVARSFVRRPALGNSILEGGRPVRVTASESGAVHDAQMLTLDEPRLLRCLELIARGLHLHIFGKRWLGPTAVHTDFVDRDEEAGKAERDKVRLAVYRAANTHFATRPQQGENPDVFWFKASAGPEGRLMRLCFYGGCTVTVFFGALPIRLA